MQSVCTKFIDERLKAAESCTSSTKSATPGPIHSSDQELKASTICVHANDQIAEWEGSGVHTAHSSTDKSCTPLHASQVHINWMEATSQVI